MMRSIIILLAHTCIELTPCRRCSLLVPTATWWSLYHCCPQFTDENTETLADEMTCPGDSAIGKRTRIWTAAAWLPASLPLFHHHELLGEPFCLSHYSYLQNKRGKQIRCSGPVLPARSSSILNICNLNVFEENINTYYFLFIKY